MLVSRSLLFEEVLVWCVECYRAGSRYLVLRYEWNGCEPVCTGMSEDPAQYGIWVEALR